MDALPLVRAASLEALPGLVHGLTTRAGGVSPAPFDSLNLGLGTDDDPARAAENRGRVAEALGFDALHTPYQVHGRRVHVVREAPAGRLRGDGLATDQPGLLLGVLGADCPGVLLVDAPRRALALVHAGWRGVAARIVVSALRTMRASFGTDPSEVQAFLGVGIGAARYEVGASVLEAMRRAVPRPRRAAVEAAIAPTRPGHARLDLRAVLALQLEAAGLDATRIEQAAGCTFDDAPSWFSHRRDGARSGRHALVAGWRA